MNLYFDNFAMLIALAALAIPPVIHLLRRRRFDMVEWGAMQFLHMEQNKRRRMWIEELILMLLRMALIALIVMGLAAPFSETSVLAPMAGDQQREYVVLLDGSASMAMRTGGEKSPHRRAMEWINEFGKTLKTGDRFSVYRVENQSPSAIIEPTRNHSDLARETREIPVPSGSADWPAALQSLFSSWEKNDSRGLRDVVCVTDGRRFGWTSDGKRKVWQAIADSWKDSSDSARPRLWLVNVGDGKDSRPPNYALAPIETSRAVAWVGQTLRFKSELKYFGPDEPSSMPRVHWKLNGNMMGEVETVALNQNSLGNVEIAFQHKFEKKGSHVVSLVVDATAANDSLRSDNERFLAIHVNEQLPVLLIDGDPKPSPKSSTYFIRNALAIASEPGRPPLIAAQTVSHKDWQPKWADKESRPRVIVLADVPSLSKTQQKAVADFLADGGGVLVVLGPRAVAGRDFYNSNLKWLPGRLIGVAKESVSAAIDTTRLSHRALELFRTSRSSTLGSARFPQWWKVKPSAGSQTAAFLTTNDPLLIEGKRDNGRVLLCTVPLDRSWNVNFTRVFEFPVFLHEMVYYLADTRKTQFNVQQGQPIRLPVENANRESGTIVLPDGKEKKLALKGSAAVWEETNKTGIFRMHIGKDVYSFVVQSDLAESDLAAASKVEQKTVERLVGIQALTHLDRLHEHRTTEKQDLWWLFFFGVLLFLCGEVWMTRRMALRGY